MARKRTIQIDIVGNAKGAQNALGSLNVTLGGIANRFGQLLGVAGLFGLVRGLQNAGKAAIDMAIQFESSMAKIVGLTGASQSQVDEWSRDLLELGPKVAKGPQELADTLFFVASAGVEAGREIEVLEAAAKASAAGLGDMDTIADAATSAMNAYGASNLSATAAIDVLIGAVRDGKAEPEEMAGAFGRIIPIAAEMGVEFHEVGAAVAAMSNLGLDANESVTALRGTLAALLKPSAEAEKTLKEFGTSSAEVRRQLREEGLLATLVSLKERFGDNETAMAKVFGNVRALAGVLNLVGNNLETTEDIFQSMSNTTGQLDAAFENVTQTAGFKLQQAMTELRTIGTQVGADMLPLIVDAVKDFMPALRELLPALAEFATVLMQTASAVMPVVVTGTKAVSRALTGLNWVITGITGTWDENARATNLMIEAQEHVRQEIERGHDPVTALANSIAHLARNGELTSDQINKLAREFGATPEVLELVRNAMMDYARSGTEAEITTAEVATAFNNAEGAAEAFSPELERLRGHQQDLGSSSVDLGEDLEGLQTDFEETSEEAVTLSEKLQEAMEAQESLSNVLLEAADPVFKAVNSYTRYVDSLEEYEKAAEDPKTTTAELAELQLEVARNALTAQGSLDQLDGQSLENALASISTALGITKTETRKLLTELGILDGKRVLTVVQVRAPRLRYTTTRGGDVVPLPAGSQIFARGGIVTGPTSAIIGEAGDDEAVIPLNSRGISFLAQAIRRAGGVGNVTASDASSKPLHVDLVVDGKVLASTLVEDIADAIRKREDSLR